MTVYRKWVGGEEDRLESIADLPLPRRQWVYHVGDGRTVGLELNPGNALFNPYRPSFFFRIETDKEGYTHIDPSLGEINAELNALGIRSRPHYRKAYREMRKAMKDYKSGTFSARAPA